ncbi:MAG: DedA family protein [Acidobacteriota bacterium]|nr:DedA family protein [Acidobacteriota bacterium]
MLKWIMEVISSMGYVGIIFLMFVENVFPPIPSELIIPLAGFMITKGQLTFLGVVVAGTIGSVLGALPLYYLGKTIEEERLRGWINKYGRWLAISCRDIDRSKEWFEKYGGRTVLFCRLVPGVRSLISIPAGIERMNLMTFLAASAVGMALWTTVLTTAGYLLGSNFTKVEEYLDPVSYFLVGGLIVFYIYRVITHKNK